MFDQEVSKNNKSVRSVGVQTEGNNDKNLKSIVMKLGSQKFLPLSK